MTPCLDCERIWNRCSQRESRNVPIVLLVIYDSSVFDERLTCRIVYTNKSVCVWRRVEKNRKQSSPFDMIKCWRWRRRRRRRQREMKVDECRRLLRDGHGQCRECSSGTRSQSSLDLNAPDSSSCRTCVIPEGFRLLLPDRSDVTRSPLFLINVTC